MSWKSLSIVFTGILILSVFVLMGSASTETKNYGFDVSITPESDHPGVYLANLKVTSLNTDQVIAAPMIRFQAGQSASSTASSEEGVSFVFSTSVNQEGSIAEYQVKVLNGTTVVSSSQAKINLAR